jgi:hypothetical protein
MLVLVRQYLFFGYGIWVIGLGILFDPFVGEIWTLNQHK